MLYLYLAFLLLCLLFVKVAGRNAFHQDYLAKENTTAVNGIFVGVVFFSHVSLYLTLPETTPNKIFDAMNIGQLMVTTFLFYSGYGLLCSIRAKGLPYVKKIPWERLFKVWLHFAIAVCLFLIAGYASGERFAIKKILLAFTGAQSVGNSSWYIFGILGEYVIFWISFQVLRIRDNKQTRLAGLLLTTLLTAAYVIWIRWMGKDTWCYNSLAMFPLGVAWGLYHEKVDRLLHEKSSLWLVALALTIAIYELGVMQRNVNLVWYTVFCGAFAVAMLLVSMRIQLNSPVLNFFGKHVFSVYILQRLSMIILSDMGWIEQKPYLSLILVILCTSSIAVGFDWVMDKLYKKLHLK